jgi:hypothetical protein
MRRRGRGKETRCKVVANSDGSSSTLAIVLKVELSRWMRIPDIGVGYQLVLAEARFSGLQKLV